MSKERWAENFRPDGKRGRCPECNESFDMNSNETLRTAMVRHYQENHPDRVLKAEAYMNRIETEVSKELVAGKKND